MQPGDIVEHLVVQRAPHRRAGRLDVAEVRDATRSRVRFSLDRHFHLEGMAVDRAIGMAGGEVVEMVRGVEAEAVGDFH